MAGLAAKLRRIHFTLWKM